MKRVLLFRHAKSDWSHDGLSDRDRPLAPRGVKVAPRMGRYIQKNNLTPDVVYCSPARRAEETCALAIGELISAPQIIINDALYDFSGEAAYFDVIRNSDNVAETVMLVGHNPTLFYLAQMLVSTGDDGLRSDMNMKFPTAALAVISFDVNSWHEIEPDTGNLEDYAKPRKLTKTDYL
ncbi:MAG: SixA phosphatase family protein [Hyphomicrobiales bacterium]